MKAVLDAPVRAHDVLEPPAAREYVLLDPPVVRGRAAGDPPPPPATGARRLAADPDAVDAVGEALAALHEDGDPGTVPVVLAAGDYCVHAADTFAAHCDDPARRLRPSDSVALEPSGLLRRFTALTGWRGPGYTIAEPTGDGTVALRLARALVGTGRAPAVYLCEVLRRPDTGAFWAVAARVRRTPAQPPRPGTAPVAPSTGAPARPDAAGTTEACPGTAPGPAAGLDPVTLRRSIVLRAYLHPTPLDLAEEQKQ
ncbi:hypothetical protein ACU639_37030 [Streptomyces cynarae]|uniref:hypothetical protein n=1 Tax=Streptomyces cynarae TaxID=2981134 RepID=UPI00406C8E41